MNKKIATILDGQALADRIKTDLKKKIAASHRVPGLAVILVGDLPASELYIRLKEKAAKEIGVNFHKYLCNHDCYDDISESKLIEMIKFLNSDPAVSGILIQLPLPSKYHPQKIINAIDPAKDADGFHPKNSFVIPPTVAAVIELLRATKKNLSDKSTLILSKSNVFLAGLEKYLKQELKIKKISASSKITPATKNYDIIIIALGQPQILKKNQVKSEAIVIDVGINKLEGKTVGDVDPQVAEVAEFVSPVPGGVGPLTVACLLKNVYLLS